MPPGEKAAGRLRAERVLREAIEEVRRDQPAAEVEPLVADGPAAQVLVDMSADADMLVVGSRGRGGFAGLLLGSVSQQCVHHAHCPVTVIREPDGAHGSRR
jgi:nucleotide-binding universal stress UspA family protein